MTDENGCSQQPKRPSLKLQADDARRKQFKARSKDLERGVSATLLSPAGEAKAPLPLSEKEAITVGQGQGHAFVKKTFFQPTYCHHCAEMLWGLKGQGMKCPGRASRVLLSRAVVRVRARACTTSYVARSEQQYYSWLLAGNSDILKLRCSCTYMYMCVCVHSPITIPLRLLH